MYVVVVTVTNPYSPTDLFLFQPQRRSTAATEKNATSSRSHGVGIITIGAEQFDSDSEQDPYGPRPGVLYVIDLAGSERSADSAKHSKERMDETKAVNLSLMSLKECIRARTAAAKPADPNNPNARPHVPYRRSKLTLLMKDVFDIECRRMCSTVVVACVSPSARDAAHSVNTLTYAAPLRVAIAATKDAAPLPVDPITIGAEQFDSDSEQDPYGPRPGVLYVIDLAGSERSADSAKHSKERMDETKAVNLSLMSLKECIRARTAAAKPADPNNPNARPHVPYRRSKLTLLMKDVFDIECRRMCSTVVVACVSPSARDAAHSVNTLTYAAPLRVAIAATKDAAPLPVDPKDPVQWSHDRACDWLEEQVKAFPNSKSR